MNMYRRQRAQRPRIKHYQWKLDERLNLTLDVNGAASGQLAPGGARERWVITMVNVRTTNIPALSTEVPQLIMFRSSAVPGNELGGTFNALIDASVDHYELNMNEPIVFEITEGDEDSIVHIHIEGIRHVWG